MRSRGERRRRHGPGSWRWAEALKACGGGKEASKRAQHKSATSPERANCEPNGKVMPGPHCKRREYSYVNNTLVSGIKHAANDKNQEQVTLDDNDTRYVTTKVS